MNPALETLVLALAEHRVGTQNVLFLGAEPHPDLPTLTAWQPLKPLANACERAGMVLTEYPTGQFPTVLFLPGKSKEETLAGFAMAHRCLAEGGVFITAMANTAGAARFEKELGNVTPLFFPYRNTNAALSGFLTNHHGMGRFWKSGKSWLSRRRSLKLLSSPSQECSARNTSIPVRSC